MPGMASGDGRRAELLRELEAAGRAQSAATVMYHGAVAARRGLSATEEKALDLLDRFGPLTAGELARHAGLAPASVTGLVDRLERKGVARRLSHPRDGRSVLVDEELELILRSLNEVAERQRQATARLTG